MINYKNFEFLKENKLDANILKDCINSTFPHLNFEILNDQQRQSLLNDLNKDIINNSWDHTKEKNIKKWDKGWSEIAENFVSSGNKEDLTPQYVKSNILRVCNNFVKFDNLKAEHIIAEQILKEIFQSHIKSEKHIYQFGCGTCKNLLILDELFSASLYASDWANGVERIVQRLNLNSLNKIYFNKFNMLSPPKEYNIKQNSAVPTIHSMEQLGKNFTPFIEYLKYQKPNIIINIEPEDYFYTNSEFDLVAKNYHLKRGYLEGFYNFLVKEEKEGNIEIISVKKYHFGSLRHDAYNFLVWRPI